MIGKQRITQGVVNILRMNMGLQSGEKVLIVTDVPTLDEWVKYDFEKLTDFIERSILARTVNEVARENFSDVSVEFCPYTSTGRHGVEPEKEIEEKMKAAAVVLAITTYSLSHTEVRENATKAGVRIASMPMFLADMLYPGGPMTADYGRIEIETERIAAAIMESKEAIVTSPGGTNMKFDVEGRKVIPEAGNFRKKGAWGNLPAGEAACAPIEGTGEGKLVVEVNWFPSLKENMTFVFKNGVVIDIMGGGKVGKEFRSLLALQKNEEPYISRRNLAELGVGTNPNAKRLDNILEAEKIKGTVHMAIGNSLHIGGKVPADVHQDFIIPRPTLLLDRKTIIQDGNLLI